MEQLLDKIFSIKSPTQFEAAALEVFHFQRENCEVYRQYIEHLNRPLPKKVEEIPFLPIRFFKSHKVVSCDGDLETVFKSSGTTMSGRSKHYVKSLEIYERSFIKTFEDTFGPAEQLVIIALLPNYIEQGESSLVYMVDKLIERSKNTQSGFLLNDLAQCAKTIQLAQDSGQKVILFGVSYALLDLADLKPNLQNVRVIETGGMKGRREEWSKEKLHHTLNLAFNTPYISSEYGMTELLSQAYSDKNGEFSCPNYLKVVLRDPNDPFQLITEQNKTGGINVIDLANVYSCSFIETQDLGRLVGTNFQLLGRFDHSDIRGCNLLMNNFDVA